MPRHAVLALVTLVVTPFMTECQSGHPAARSPRGVLFAVILDDPALRNVFVRGPLDEARVTAARSDGVRVQRTTQHLVAHFRLEPGRYTFSAPKCATQTVTVSSSENAAQLRCHDLVPHVP